ncbi:hypothetical protein THAOC_18120, partial [Thalassiosira oceanica]
FKVLSSLARGQDKPLTQLVWATKPSLSVSSGAQRLPAEVSSGPLEAFFPPNFWFVTLWLRSRPGGAVTLFLTNRFLVCCRYLVEAVLLAKWSAISLGRVMLQTRCTMEVFPMSILSDVLPLDPSASDLRSFFSHIRNIKHHSPSPLSIDLSPEPLRPRQDSRGVGMGAGRAYELMMNFFPA